MACVYVCAFQRFFSLQSLDIIFVSKSLYPPPLSLSVYLSLNLYFSQTILNIRRENVGSKNILNPQIASPDSNLANVSPLIIFFLAATKF